MPTQARAVLESYGHAPGDGTRGLPAEARAALKGALLVLANAAGEQAQHDARAARLKRQPTPVTKKPRGSKPKVQRG